MKYELTSQKKIVKLLDGNKTVYRIRALKDIPCMGVKSGDLGGFIESTDNLSQDGYCWVGGDAVALSTADILDNALVTGNAIVQDATIFGLAVISGHAVVIGNIIISGDSMITRNSVIKGNNIRIHGKALITDNAQIIGHNIEILDNVYINMDSRILNQETEKPLVIKGYSIISDNKEYITHTNL